MIKVNYQYLVVAVVVVFTIVSFVVKAHKRKHARALAYFNKAASGRSDPQFVTIYEIAKAASISHEVALDHMEYLIRHGVLVSELFPNGEVYYKVQGAMSFLEYQKMVQGNIKYS
ncbi:MAG: hypothetical protein ACOYN2_04740 [Patescibacteria group bacterium]